jgi:hypothetical protein
MSDASSLMASGTGSRFASCPACLAGSRLNQVFRSPFNVDYLEGVYLAGGVVIVVQLKNYPYRFLDLFKPSALRLRLLLLLFLGL